MCTRFAGVCRKETEVATNIYVGNLPFSTNADEIRDLFSAYGTVESVNLRSNGLLPGPTRPGSAFRVVSTLASRYAGERMISDAQAAGKVGHGISESRGGRACPA